MSLQQALNEGDWVRAESKYGVVIEGQVTHDKALLGTANLIIMIDPTAALEEDRTIEINVNFFDVHLVKPSLQRIAARHDDRQMRAAKEAWRRAGLDE